MQTFNKIPRVSDLQVLNPKCRAVLWDMDGTIMETEQLHTKATINLLDRLCEQKITDQEVHLICMGNTDQVIHQTLQEMGLISVDGVKFIELKNDELAHMLKSIARKDIFNEDVLALMRELKENGLSQVVVTSSEKLITKRLLDYLELSELFEFVITREDTTENKPSPQPYTTALSKLMLSADQAIIFEDSTVGLSAAVASEAVVCHAQWYTPKSL